MDPIPSLGICSGGLILLILARVIWELTKGSGSGGEISTFPDGWNGFDD